MNNSPIGIFDSGIGGITILNSIKKILPNENIIYFSDNFNSPYGNKSKKEILKLSVKNTKFLIDKGCKIIVVACNTATTNSIKELRSEFKIPFVGIEPAIKPAAMQTKSGLIGVLATKGTLSSGLFGSTTNDYASEIKIIEKGFIDGDKIEKNLKKYLFPMIDKGIDHLVLGCTHYPLLIKTIRSLIPKNIKIIDSGKAVAKQTKKLIEKNNIESNLIEVKYSFYCNGSPKSLNMILNNTFAINSI